MKKICVLLALLLCAALRADAQEEARLQERHADTVRTSVEVMKAGSETGSYSVLPDNNGRLAFDSSLAIALQRALDSIRTIQHVTGVSAAVLVPGQGVWQGVSGISSKSPSANVQPAMLFGIGSNTKAFVSTTILSLADAGLLSLDDPLSRFLPTYPNINGAVTIRQLLNMTSGLYDYLNDSNAQGDAVAADPTRLWTPDELIRTFVGPPHKSPGGAYTYCNTDYVLLGMVINKVTGKSVSSQIRERILAPLSLDHTYLEVEEHYADPVAHPWDSGIDFASIPVTAHFSTLWTAGGIMSTGENMARWVKGLYEGAVITPSSLAQMLTFIPAASTQSTGLEWNGYGLGVRRGAYYGEQVFGHVGAVMGYVSITGYLSRTGASFALLFNSSEASVGGSLTALFDAYLRSVGTRSARAGVCYALAGTADSSRVYVADTSSGAMTAVGATHYGTIVGARINARTGVYWGLTSANGWELVHIDGVTGEAYPRVRVKFPTGAPTDFKGLDFAPNGDIVVGSVDGRIYRINPATGVAVLAVTSKISIAGLAFDPTSGALWASIRSSSTLRDRIYRIDFVTGDSIYAGSTGFNQPLADLAFDPSGNLFGLIGSTSSSAKYRLARINKSTGVGTEIGSVGLAGMAGIAFSPASLSTSADVQTQSVPPSAFTLAQNYPNPFNPSTTIQFSLPTRSFVSLRVFDILGRDVATLASHEMDAGVHMLSWNAHGVPSGVYFYRLQAGSFIATKKLQLVR